MRTKRRRRRKRRNNIRRRFTAARCDLVVRRTPPGRGHARELAVRHLAGLNGGGTSCRCACSSFAEQDPRHALRSRPGLWPRRRPTQTPTAERMPTRMQSDSAHAGADAAVSRRIPPRRRRRPPRAGGQARSGHNFRGSCVPPATIDLEAAKTNSKFRFRGVPLWGAFYARSATGVRLGARSELYRPDSGPGR